MYIMICMYIATEHEHATIGQRHHLLGYGTCKLSDLVPSAQPIKTEYLSQLWSNNNQFDTQHGSYSNMIYGLQ